MMDKDRRARAEALAKFLAKQAHKDPEAPFLMGEPYRVYTPWGVGMLPDVAQIRPLWAAFYGLALSIIEREEEK